MTKQLQMTFVEKYQTENQLTTLIIVDLLMIHHEISS